MDNQMNNELALANEAITLQNNENQRLTDELITAIENLAVANKELALQNIAKEKLTAELLIANKKLVLESEEKETRAAALLIANEELLFQNSEKGKRAVELEAANKELEAFTYSVSHDLRAPLRAINGFTQILVEDHHNQFDEDAKEILSEVISNSKKMGELIDDLLEFSRLGRQFKTIADVDISTLVSTCLKEVQALNQNRMVNISCKSLLHVKGDKNMLKQVFINLLSNAFKYTGKTEVAEIGCYQKDHDIVYYVKDNGAGFDMCYYDKLFGVFQRLHSTNEFEGTGVGLAIIHKIITKHGGKVWAEAAVNKGACFYISLPNT